jgi:adenylate cyclase
MESHGIVGKIQVSQTTYLHLKDEYELEKRGEIQIKGRGEMTTYFLISRNA